MSDFAEPVPSISSAPAEEMVALILRARTGDPDAQSRLVQHYQKPISRYLYTMTSDLSSIDDLCQIVFVKMVCGLGTLRDPERFVPWLYSLARHSSLDHLRRQRFRRIWAPLSDEALAAPDGDQPLERVMLRESLERATRKLSFRDRDLLARVVEGRSYEEIASAQRTTSGSVKGRLARIREALRREFEQVDLPTHE